MTNKVKPFYIRVTDDMTPQMVQDAFDKCVDAGAKSDEWETSLEPSDWEFFGFCGVSGMYLTDYSEDYDANQLGSPQEITLDQLDEWLGLEVEQEWNGEGLPPVGVECEVYGALGVCSDWHKCEVFAIKHGLVFISNGDNWTQRPIHEFKFRPVETPEQKAEREKKEEAAEMIQCLLDNYTECDDSAIEYVIDCLKECNVLGK